MEGRPAIRDRRVVVGLGSGGKVGFGRKSLGWLDLRSLQSMTSRVPTIGSGPFLRDGFDRARDSMHAMMSR